MKTSFADFVCEIFQIVGPVTTRKMFGGYGLFLDGLMFGIIDGNTLYLKTDDHSEHPFIDKGLEKFSYLRQGKPCFLNYHQAPEESLEDLDQTRYWGNLAYETAIRSSRSNNNSKNNKNNKNKNKNKSHDNSKPTRE